MDKQEFRSKIEQMLELVKNKSYEEALEIADELNWKKVKNVSILSAVSEVYEQCGEYEKSRDILFMAYDRAPDNKKIIYRLGILALKLGEFTEAEDCYEEYVNMAPKDPNRFVFKYKMLQAQNATLEEKIAVLEEFKKIEYVEKWAFELAGLYQQAGMITECLEECDDLILWFSEGKYIYKAMELKMQYKALTPLQHEKYMNRFGTQEKKEDTPEAELPKVEIPVEEPKELPKEEPVEEVVEEEVTPVEEVVEETTPVEEVAEETPEETTEETLEEIPAEPEKPTRSIEEIVQGWQEEQKENAQMIQAELERVEQEKEAEEPVEEEEKEEILSHDVRKLMEDLEAESAEIEAQKAAGDEEVEEVEEKPLLQKLVEQLTGQDKKEEAEETEEEGEIQTIETETEEEEIETTDEDEEIKLGDTQSMALTIKALANAARVETPEEVLPEIEMPEEVQEAEEASPYDTGFVVQGRYDLDAQSEIGIKAGLTEEQKKLFSYFVPVHGMSEQLVRVLEADKKCKNRYGTSRIGNIAIVGRRGSGKTVLAVNIVKAIQKARRMKHGKVAIVKADALNKKDVAEIVEKLNGGALVIEKASRLKRNTIDTLCDLMEGQTGELLVVIEDERKPLDRMFAEYPNFKKKFTSRVELPVFINDELVTFGQTYAKENGYKIDEMGILALYSDIDILQREEKVVTVSDVKALVDDAIENANRFTLKKFFKKLFGKNRDESDRVILKEEDFR